MSGTKLTFFGKENIIFILKRRSRTDWSRTKVIYGGFSQGSVGHVEGQPSFAVSYIKNQNIKTCQNGIDGTGNVKKHNKDSFLGGMYTFMAAHVPFYCFYQFAILEIEKTLGTRYVSFSSRNALSLYHESEVFEFPVQYLQLISSMGLKP